MREDLGQVAALGAVKAVAAFRRGGGASFRTFASRYARGEVLHWLRDQGHLVRLPRDVWEAERRKKPEDRMRVDPVSLDAPKSSAGGEEWTSVGETLRSPDGHFDGADLRDAVARLPRRERLCVLLCDFLGMTQTAAAAIMGISQAHVGRLHASAIRSLRAMSAGWR
jgi:RNA polymerase sigma factor (sigma-70 family)